MKKIGVALLALLLSSPAFGQAQMSPGEVWGNSTSAPAPPQAASLAAIIDRAYGASEGQMLFRG